VGEGKSGRGEVYGKKREVGGEKGGGLLRASV